MGEIAKLGTEKNMPTKSTPSLCVYHDFVIKLSKETPPLSVVQSANFASS